MLTKKQEKKYLEDSTKCPGCGSSNVHTGDMEADGLQVYFVVDCNGCGAQWQDIYKLVGIDNFKPGDEGSPSGECSYCDNTGDLVKRTNDAGDPVYLCSECADVMDGKDEKRMRD